MFLIVPHLHLSDAHDIFERSSPWWACPLFLQNFLVAVPAEAAGALGATWSLAIEEQFYLIWPLVARCFSAAQIKRIAMFVILASPLLRLFLVGHHVNIYSNFFCRLDGLMAGALLVVVLRTKTFEPARYVKLAWASFLIAACLAIFADNHQVRWIAFSMTSLASVSLVYVALFSLGKWVQWFFRNRFLTYTGIISYGLYLLHKIPLDVAKEMHGGPPFFPFDIHDSCFQLPPGGDFLCTSGEAVLEAEAILRFCGLPPALSATSPAANPVNWGLPASNAVLTAPANRPPASPSSPPRWEVHPVP